MAPPPPTLQSRPRLPLRPLLLLLLIHRHPPAKTSKVLYPPRDPSSPVKLRHRPLFSRRTPGSGGQELPGVRSSELDAANEGRIYVSAGGLARVLDAYRAQFQGDFRLFLACRAEEVRCDGLLLLLTFVARREAVPSVHDCHLWDLLAAAVEGMAAEGLVDACRLDSFEAPYYRPCPDELTEAIREEAPLR